MAFRSRVLGLLLLLSASAFSASPPNIVFILADDMGYGDPQHAGGKAPTPNLDRMAAEGMRFTDAHSSSSVCTPTRYGILTGRYNWRSSLKSGVLQGNSQPLIPPSRRTVASFLRDSGYRTAVVGKWHLGLAWKRLPEARKAESGPTEGPGWALDYGSKLEGGPLALGFDESFIIPASLDMGPYLYLRNDKPIAFPTVTKTYLRPGAATADFDAVKCLPDFARESRDFIRRSATAKDKPFFLYLPLTSPHTPIVPGPHWQGKSGIGEYGDFLMETDWVVGEVMTELEAAGIAKDTLLIFTSDNGFAPWAKIEPLLAKDHKPLGDLRGTKADIFEGGHRVPFLVRWPGIVKPGSTSPATICLNDLFATAADVAGKLTAIPADAAEDSFSLLPLLKGEGTYTRSFTIHHSSQGAFAVRQGDWKLCLCPDSGGWSDPKPGTAEAAAAYPVQLYNLKEDPAESKNLAEAEAERVKELAAALAKAIKDGRTTAGPKRDNDGKAIEFPERVTALLPILGN
ncbi:arylsulfatase [Luteolibacter sp. GHJ8]|uniref:Arylsulfatase n=1 Tax=Luteolibacter rhizosphaerae TaxID=2989719 RepID=A0ABT3GAR8_9BACT|nr:arylsulfatase [Luteolibacter rhizosphaerae]MCW1916927.1 arylsulfatase [Luteolibacter rhizosphaerae]